jgi:hypothetical protein
MNKIFIIDQYKNPGLLKFIQTKLFFNARNEAVHWASSCEVVDHIDKITETSGIVINSNQFVTTDFRKKYPNVNTLVDARQDPLLIEFDTNYDYVISHRPPFAPESKQLYILENLYKVILRSKKLIYLDNTENITLLPGSPKHFFGLASGWKSVRLVKELGINQLESITIYDKCQRQLDFQQFLHSQEQLPNSVDIEPPYYGEYNAPEDLRDFWNIWHNTQVNFKLLDLFQTPIFPDKSLIWVSNVFHYEPTMFEYGWAECQNAKQRLITQNKSCIII